jgi:transposase-like protein
MAEQTMESWLVKLQGARPWTAEEGRQVIKAWSKSGLTVAAFARKTGLKQGRVYWWREHLGTVPEAANAIDVREEPPPFLPVVLRDALTQPLGMSVPVAVCTRGGLRIEVAALGAVSAAWVASLVRSVEEVPS